MMFESFPSYSPEAVCFGNSLILHRILNYVSDHPMKVLTLRLINKNFDREVLRNVREHHRKLELDRALGKTVGIYPNVKVIYKIAVNDHEVNVETLKHYFMFLLNVAGVRVIEFRAEQFVLYEDNEKTLVHDAIHEFIRNQKLNVFTGIEGVCRDGCGDCEAHALTAIEYGPVQYNMLIGCFQSGNQKRHYRKLVVYESLFTKIANYCVLHRNCMEVMKSVINSNITCDHLELTVYDNPAVGRHRDHRLHVMQIFPREILEQMVKVWRVKTLRVFFFKFSMEKFHEFEWTQKEIFTTFRFDDPYQETPVSLGIELDSVELELSFSPLSARGVFGGPEVWSPRFLDNFLVNIQKVFPAKHYIVNNHNRYVNYDFEISKKRLEKMITAAWRNTDLQIRNTQMTLRYWANIDLSFQIPEFFYIDSKKFECYVQDSVINYRYSRKTYREVPWRKDEISDRIGKVFRISELGSESESSLSLNLEIYVNKTWLQRVLIETNREAVERSFLGHYI